MNELIAKIYGAGGGRPARPQQAKNPDWSAGASGDTVGGIGNTAAMGEDINWGRPDRADTTVGQVVNTPAGKYRVVETADGFALEPMEGALRSVGPTITNFASGQHHLGINPETGEVWYQQAKSIPSQFSGSMAAQQSSTQTSGTTYVPSFCESGWEDQYGNCVDPPPTTTTDGSNSSSDTGEKPKANISGVSGMPSGAFTSSTLRGLNILPTTPVPLMQPAQPTNKDYVRMLNQMMMRSLFKDMI